MYIYIYIYLHVCTCVINCRTWIKSRYKYKYVCNQWKWNSEWRKIRIVDQKYVANDCTVNTPFLARRTLSPSQRPCGWPTGLFEKRVPQNPMLYHHLLYETIWRAFPISKPTWEIGTEVLCATLSRFSRVPHRGMLCK